MVFAESTKRKLYWAACIISYLSIPVMTTCVLFVPVLSSYSRLNNLSAKVVICGLVWILYFPFTVYGVRMIRWIFAWMVGDNHGIVEHFGFEIFLIFLIGILIEFSNLVAQLMVSAFTMSIITIVVRGWANEAHPFFNAVYIGYFQIVTKTLFKKKFILAGMAIFVTASAIVGKALVFKGGINYEITPPAPPAANPPQGGAHVANP